MQVKVVPFGAYGGEAYDEIVITTDDGVQIAFSNLGARINRWGIKQTDGQFEQIILGHQDASEVFASNSYYGATIGRVAGRIANGEIKIGGKEYQLGRNNGAHHLHGGNFAMDLAKFDYEVEVEPKRVGVHFTLKEEEGRNGYPGDLKLKVSHYYTDCHTWTIQYEATSSQPTLINLTNHVYFNLNGNNQASIENHTLQVAASYYMPVGSDHLPLGFLGKVDGTAFDLRQPSCIKNKLTSPEPSFAFTKGYDHPFILDHHDGKQACLSLRDGQRMIEVETDQVAIVIYSHGYIPNLEKVWGNPLQSGSGIAFECQNLPDAIHHQLEGDTIIEPGQVYEQVTHYHLTLR